ncbi:hypothetical protein MOSE0_N16094 [Monosporozyma servazzii]
MPHRNKSAKRSKHRNAAPQPEAESREEVVLEVVQPTLDNQQSNILIQNDPEDQNEGTPPNDPEVQNEGTPPNDPEFQNEGTPNDPEPQAEGCPGKAVTKFSWKSIFKSLWNFPFRAFAVTGSFLHNMIYGALRLGSRLKVEIENEMVIDEYKRKMESLKTASDIAEETCNSIICNMRNQLNMQLEISERQEKKIEKRAKKLEDELEKQEQKAKKLKDEQEQKVEKLKKKVDKLEDENVELREKLYVSAQEVVDIKADRTALKHELDGLKNRKA